MGECVFCWIVSDQSESHVIWDDEERGSRAGVAAARIRAAL